MRILMLHEFWKPAYWGGEVHLENVMRELKDEGYTFDIVTRNLGGSYQKIEHHDNFTVYRVGPATRYSGITNILGKLFYIPFALWQVKKLNYDIIHASSLMPVIPGFVLKFFTRKPLVTTIHGTIVGSERFSPGIMGRLYSFVRSLSEKILIYNNIFDKIITVDKNYDNHSASLGVRKGKVVYIPNGIWEKEFKLKLPKKENYILFVGRLNHQKGVRYLIEAAAVLKKQFPDVKIKIRGDGPLKKDLVQLSKQLGVTDVVEFMEGSLSRKQLVHLYARAKIFVLPSLWEGLPLAALEAMAAGTPILSTGVGGLREITVEGKNGFLVKPADSKALAQKISIMLNAPAKLKSMGDFARKYALENYTWKKTAEKISRVYASLA